MLASLSLFFLVSLDLYVEENKMTEVPTGPTMTQDPTESKNYNTKPPFKQGRVSSVFACSFSSLSFELEI